jgi:uncharacterized protein (TIGR03118 family)
MKYSVVCLATAALLFTSPRNASTQPRTNVYIMHGLVSDLRGQAEVFDPNLSNPWGIALSSASPFWISDNHTGVATVYDSNGRPFPSGNPLVVTIPPPAGGMPPAAPTGIVFNGTNSFALATGMPARFIFTTEDGTISGWNPMVDPTNAVLKVDQSTSGAVYKGLAMGHNGAGDFLYATNFHAGTVDVFDTNFSPAGTFTDPPLMALGFAPFGIRNIGGQLYVTFAKQDADAHDDVAGPGNGYVDIFNTDGTPVKRLISNGPLNSPWGLAPAPANFGQLSGSLLIGNFGDGTINGFDVSNGAFLGQMLMPSGRPLSIPGLWGLIFGNGGNGGDPGTLYFTAGIPGPGGAVEDHGLFGQIRPQQP